MRESRRWIQMQNFTEDRTQAQENKNKETQGTRVIRNLVQPGKKP